MFKIRYHLQQGEHYRHFQIRFRDKVSYINPETHSLIIFNCYLKNSSAMAKKICAGANRQPCAWIIANSYQPLLTTELILKPGVEIIFDPKVLPYWRWSRDDSNIDNYQFEKLITIGKKLYQT